MLQRHANEGENIAEVICDCLDYGKNPEKTEDGKYISSYECDPATVAAEFLFGKGQLQGHDRLGTKEGFYQIRQSFYPGEITPEEANRISYALDEDMLIMIDNGHIVFQEEKDTLLDYYRIVKGDVRYLNAETRKLFLSTTETAFGFSGITKKISEVQRLIPDVVVERPTIEDIMLGSIEGGKK